MYYAFTPYVSQQSNQINDWFVRNNRSAFGSDPNPIP